MWSRREFLAASSLATSGLLITPEANSAALVKRRLTEDQRRSLLAAIQQEEHRYDPEARMLRGPFDDLARQTAIKLGEVHPTRQSLTYAAALFDAQVQLERAKDVLRRVIALQDQDSKSDTYGLWPRFLEEPLKKGPPDWNSADFCGTQLLSAWLSHRNTLDGTLADQVRNSILHAARSIERRDVSPSHTSIAIMGTYVTLVAASEFKLPDLRDYARDRLLRLYHFITEQGSFSEYNSPADTTVAIAELSRMVRDVKDGRNQQLARELHDLAWKHAATHFHAATKQWAGPHSRCDETDLRKRPDILAALDAATSRRAHLLANDPLPLGLDASRLPLKCPRRWIKPFHEQWNPRQVVETFLKADPRKPGAKHAIVGTTWLHPNFTLGSVNRGDFWEQRRPLLAYWGTPKECAFLRLRFLRDARDFASALFFSAQHQGHLIAAVVFATDYEDSHPSFKKVTDPTITTQDLRLRFDLGGELRGVIVRRHSSLSDAIVIESPTERFVIRPLGGSFDGQPVEWAVPEATLTDHLDAVIYQGIEKSIALSKLKEAFVCFSLHEWPRERKTFGELAPEFMNQAGHLRVSLNLAVKALEVTGPSRPGSFAELNDGFATSAT